MYRGRLARIRFAMALRDRGYLPHLEHPHSSYFVTFRLAETLPKTVLEDFAFERSHLQRDEFQKRQLTTYERAKLQYLLSNKVQEYLDRSEGECWLNNPAIARLVIQTMQHFNGTRYQLEAWCVMPNHVHVVFQDLGISNLNSILHSWKSYTAHEANKILNRTGKFWHNEYYDHSIRNDEDFAHCVEYTLYNPVKAKLCKKWQDWPWSGCSEEIRRKLAQWML
jgi:REP element-mobilizing transposase RayT